MSTYLMRSNLSRFEGLTRKASQLSFFGRNSNESETTLANHPFDERNLHPEIAAVALRLFDDGHFSQCVFEAFKVLEKSVKRRSGQKGEGYNLMMQSFDPEKPRIRLNPLASESDRDEQNGYRYMFAGSMTGIRNRRAHDVVHDSLDSCLDYLSLASLLIRKLDTSNF